MNKTKLHFALKYWRLAFHLIFKTRHFGVNNRWWVQQPSAIGWRWYQQAWGILTIMPIVRNYQSLKVRSCLGWIPQADCEALGYQKEIASRVRN
ncbi:hypothetical protein AVO42_07235 [Thiomicrospira sp. XS5]|uniref:hypothetical protein n=1 Tax=Thiomicrospira sp. XS5 TaxID=1775636 RepID=UPI000746F2D5|nr:hypothetical protein [Thiomicrospira sp. XS5]KUJ75136.1 hypothetical protein AVO42_07235 [Thiomicrospira sp. XS5]